MIDASIALAWCFAGENSLLAQHVAERFQRGDLAVAPSFWPHEVLNALLSGEKRGRISRKLVQNFLEDLAALPVELFQFPAATVFERIQPHSLRHDLTAYDAAYLDLALDMNLPLATLDKDLIQACDKAGAALVKV